MKNTNSTLLVSDAVPCNYMRCILVSCPLGKSCLRNIAWRNLRSDSDAVVVVNPKLATSADGCPYFASCIPERYAVGFTRMQQQMFPAQYSEFMAVCRKRFGRNGYFLRRRGAVPMPPSEQQFVRKVLDRVGVSADIAFDEYEERINWHGE